MSSKEREKVKYREKRRRQRAGSQGFSSGRPAEHPDIGRLRKKIEDWDQISPGVYLLNNMARRNEQDGKSLDLPWAAGL